MLEDGSQLRLERFQRDLLADYFAGATETLILIPKKNGKTTLLAALSLFHLCSTPDAECVLAAASRDQATILFDQARGFVERTEGLQIRVDVKRGFREIRSRRDSGRIRVLASDVDTADGVIPTLALVDELHRHKSAELYGVFRDGLGPRSGRMLTISTAGWDQSSPLGVMREAAHKLPVLERQGAHCYARTADRRYVLHEWSLEPGEDADDMKVVKRANPAPWHTVAALRHRHDSPSMTPWAWQRFACNIWTSAEEPWLPVGAWEACRESGVGIPSGEAVWLGVDVGVKSDHSAVVAVARAPDGRFVAHARIWEPPKGGELDISEIEAYLVECGERWRVAAVAYDKMMFVASAQALADRLLMHEYPQTNVRMCPASQRLFEAIVSRDIVHDADNVFTAHVQAGITVETDRGWKIAKHKTKQKIDALVALAMAFDIASDGVNARPVSRVPFSFS